MVSSSSSVLLPLPLCYGSFNSLRFALYSSNMSKSRVSEKGKILCACMAPPRNVSEGFSAFRLNDSSELKNLSSAHDPEGDSDVLIECRNVYKSFGEKHILRGVCFKIRHGEAIGIIGPSGTGKSTILKIIAGLLAPDKGEVYIRGRKRHGLISDDEISQLCIGLATIAPCYHKRMHLYVC
ncbi:Protein TRIGALACTOSYLDIACYLGLYCEROL 3, chloroplastic [Ancistrocladus abbreviatus]